MENAITNDIEQKVYLELYKHENSVVNDAYDRLMAGIHLHKKNDGYSTYTITSCEPGAGATTIAISLAISMARSGWKTVLIDTDMKKGSNYKRLNQKINFGLSDYLTNLVPMRAVFCATNYENLKYISCGVIQENAVELLCSSNFLKLLNQIKADFDYAIFDSSSINAAVDASILATKTDSVILVAEQNKTKISQIQASKRETDNVGAELLGIVLNKVNKDEYKRFLKSYDYFKINKFKKKKKK